MIKTMNRMLLAVLMLGLGGALSTRKQTITFI